MGERPVVIIVAGANGAGKSTAARGLLADFLRLNTFVNADTIAGGLAAFDPASAAIEAGRLMLGRLRELTDARQSFAFETTLAGRGYLHWIEEWRSAGYRVSLLYIWLSDPDLNVARVAQRVVSGGHDIPEQLIRHRWSRSLRNFWSEYAPIVHEWSVYNNESPGRRPMKVAQAVDQAEPVVTDPELWSRFCEYRR